ncbi:MAG: hypothetical protein COA61_000185 [Zetaproteobacteria bacterium]|nr:hypothetical protein [Zetaproteobacteria bacterium]
MFKPIVFIFLCLIAPNMSIASERNISKHTQAEDHMLLLTVMSAALRERLYNLKNIRFLEEAGLPHVDARLVYQTLLLEISTTRTQILLLITHI